MKNKILNFDISRIGRYLPILTLFLLVLVFFSPIIFEGKTFYPFDCLFEYLPWAPFNQGAHPQNQLITDPINAYYPPHFYSSHYYYQKALESGSLSWWFKYIFSGLPYLYYSYPLSYLFFSFLPISLAHDLFLFLHLFGAGLFTYYYLKKIGLNRFPSMIGAISWMFNGYVMVWFEFEHVPMLAAIMPASLLCIELWMERRNTYRFLCLVMVFSLTICVSYAHLIIYQLLFIGAYILFRIWSFPVENQMANNVRLRKLVGIVCAISASIIISAYFFTSHVLLLKSGQRESIPYHELYNKTGKLPAKYLFTMFFPDLFGSPSSEVSFKFKGLTPSYTPLTNKNQVYNNYNELCVYAGILPALLALFCVPYFRRYAFIKFFLISSFLCLLMAMGSFIYYPLAKFIPGLNLSTPTRILYLFGFSISILSALGAQILSKNQNDKQVHAVILWLIILFISAILIAYLQTENGRKWLLGAYYLSKWKNYHNVDNILKLYLGLSSTIILKPIMGIISGIIILLGLLFTNNTRHKNILFLCSLILLTYDLMSFGQVYNTTSSKFMEFPETPAIRFLKKDTEKYRIMTFGRFLPNSFIPFGIENIGGYGSFYPKRYGEYLYKSQYGSNALLPDNLSRWIVFEKFGSPLLDLLNTKYILTDSKIRIKSSQLKLVYDNEINIYRNVSAFPRVFFVSKYELAENPGDAYEKIGRYSREDFKSKVILEKTPSYKIWEKNDKTNSKNISTVIKIVSYLDDTIDLRVSTDSRGFIVISDNYFPGWFAYVDGKKTEILKANYIMRAIPIAAGNHIVRLEFKPQLLITGFFITIIGWVMLIGMMLFMVTKIVYVRLKKNRKS